MFFSSRALLSTSLCSGLSLLALTPACVLADTTDNLMHRSTLTGDCRKGLLLSVSRPAWSV